VIHAFELVGTTADSSIIHFVAGATAVAAIGAIHYWWPHILTRPLREGLANVSALVLLLGVAALAIPDIVSGFLDEPAGSLYTNVRDGVTAMNAVSLAGGALVALGVLLFVVNLAVSLARGGSNGDEEVVDPWEGQTLEWAADASTVTVTSAAPLLDAREASS
jgi:cytochrome c oxidase subunit 1/cytochrome c oxidase subunit I+III